MRNSKFEMESSNREIWNREIWNSKWGGGGSRGMLLGEVGLETGVLSGGIQLEVS